LSQVFAIGFSSRLARTECRQEEAVTPKAEPHWGRSEAEPR
jgi:hypothetical protein